MLYYKIARTDGWDFHTGRTINYRDCVGKEALAPNPAEVPELCAPGVLHASLRAEDCFQGGHIPCSLYRVQGIPVVTDGSKGGFLRFNVLEELDPAQYFLWRYTEACQPLLPLSITPPAVGQEHLDLLRDWASVRTSVGDSVRASVWASVRASVRTSVGDSVWEIVWTSVWASVCASVCASVWASVRTSVRTSLGDSVGDSVWDSVWAYVGWIFVPVVPQWRDAYPYQAIVDLWRQGLVASHDGRLWRLHGGPQARTLWHGTP